MTAHATATADTAGLEPAASHCIDTVVDAGALPFKSYMSCDSFLAGESDPVVGGQTPFADRGGSTVSGSHKPRPSGERLPVELTGSVVSTGGRIFHRLFFHKDRIQAV